MQQNCQVCTWKTRFKDCALLLRTEREIGQSKKKKNGARRESDFFSARYSVTFYASLPGVWALDETHSYLFSDFFFCIHFLFVFVTFFVCYTISDNKKCTLFSCPPMRGAPSFSSFATLNTI